MGTAVLTKRLNSRCSRGSSSWGDLKMAKSITETSPRLKGRISGAVYLLTMLTRIFAQGFVSDGLVESFDAAATETNILRNKSLFQLVFTFYVIELACQMAM